MAKPTIQQGETIRRAPSAAKVKAAKKDALDDARTSIKIDGEIYTVDPTGITGTKERVVLAEIGMSVMQFIEEIEEHPGVYTLGVFMWIAKLSTAPNNNLPELGPILDSIGYGSEVEVVEVPKGPEA